MQKLIYSFLLILSGQFVLAQQAMQNNGSLQVHNGGAMVSHGALTNASTGVFLNNGSVYIKGNLINHESSMSAGSGTLYLNGTTAQAVNGTDPMKTSGLVTDNTAGITLNNNLSVAGSHTFTNGLIHSSATPHYLIYEAGATHSGSTDGRHVTGWVKKNGTDNFTFPVGDNNYLRPVSVSNLSASSEFNAHYYTTTADVYNMLSPLVKVRAAEYWQVDKVSGGNAEVTLTWDHSKVAMDNILLADIRVGHYTGGIWTNAGGSATGDVATTGSVSSNAISSFSPFTLAYISFPIPLKLVSFTGWRRSGTNFLHWISENEQDVSHFAVERSTDAINFSSIGTVSARNRGIRELYSLEDPVNYSGTLYYRLKNIDNDGSFTYSRVIALVATNITGEAITVQNPVQTAITLYNRSAPGGQYAYQLVSSSGQLILKGRLHLGSNAAVLLPLPIKIAPGIYVLELVMERNRFVQHVLVER